MEDAYLLGTPVMATRLEWEELAAVCSGRVVNGYLKKDWVLGYLYRASSALWKDVAGLNPILGVEGIENMQLDDVIDGHLGYRLGMPKILEKMGFKTWRDYVEDEEDEDKKDKIEMKEELAAIKAEKNARKGMGSRKESIVFNSSEFEDAGVVIKELVTTLPVLVVPNTSSETSPVI